MKKEQHQNKIGNKTPVSTLGYLVFKVLMLLKLTSKVCEQNFFFLKKVLSLPYQDDTLEVTQQGHRPILGISVCRQSQAYNIPTHKPLSLSLCKMVHTQGRHHLN